MRVALAAAETQPTAIQSNPKDVTLPAIDGSSNSVSLNSSNASSYRLNSSMQRVPRPPSTRAEDAFRSPRLKSVVTTPRNRSLVKAKEDSSSDVKFPISPAVALRSFSSYLTNYEQSEVLDYKQIYYLGQKAVKPKTDLDSINYGYDDERGDYSIVTGDHISYRYEIIQILGRGSFGQVCKCMDHKQQQYVAVKIIRNKKRFHQQGIVEVKVLEHMREHDPEDSNNVVHLWDRFLFRKHLVRHKQCISFELLSINLYELLKSNKFQGLSIGLVKRFAIQILNCLKFSKQLKIIHCDLKPENILLKAPNKSTIKVIDYGSSCFIDERIYTYIQSRFYRAPEIMLGIPYTCAIDMWSFGCILAELFSGYPLFPGESEHEQLLCIMEVKGVPPSTLLAEATRKKLFFDISDAPKIVANTRGRKRYPQTRLLEEKIGTNERVFLDLVERKV
jgi:dual specificity tyrosine-phosphorylation-regulated kinase 2/3/4